MAEFLPYPSRSVAIASEYTDIGSSYVVPEEDADIIVVAWISLVAPSPSTIVVTELPEKEEPAPPCSQK